MFLRDLKELAIFTFLLPLRIPLRLCYELLQWGRFLAQVLFGSYIFSSFFLFFYPTNSIVKAMLYLNLHFNFKPVVLEVLLQIFSGNLLLAPTRDHVNEQIQALGNLAGY